MVLTKDTIEEVNFNCLRRRELPRDIPLFQELIAFGLLITAQQSPACTEQPYTEQPHH